MPAPPHVLIAADDRSVRSAVGDALHPAGSFVQAATNISSALSVLAHHPIDIVVVEVKGREECPMDTIDLVRLVRERKPDVDVVGVAARPSATMTSDAIASGAVDCLSTAELAGQIGAVITDIMERRRYGREHVPWPDAKLEEQAIIGHNGRFIEVYKQVARLAKSNDPVLIVGERGTGKTAVAREIHRLSRAGAPFEVLESTSIADGIAESELFGHVQGAFTDAKRNHKGYFERAGRGTLVIDEVVDLTPAAQGKFLRVLQEREFVPVGATTPIKVKARVVAITNRSLKDAVDAGQFRPDLHDRLLVSVIDLPPLRDRRDDIPELARHFIATAARELKLASPPAIVPEAVAALAKHDWPGNVRELEHVINRAVLRAAQFTTQVVLLRDLDVDGEREDCLAGPHKLTRGPGRRYAGGSAGPAVFSQPDPTVTTGNASLDDQRSPMANDSSRRRSGVGPGERPALVRTLAAAERDHVKHILKHAQWNKSRAAAILQISRTRLDRLIDRYGITRSENA